MTKLQIKNYLIKQLLYYQIKFIFKGKLYIHNGSQMHNFITKLILFIFLIILLIAQHIYIHHFCFSKWNSLQKN